MVRRSQRGEDPNEFQRRVLRNQRLPEILRRFRVLQYQARDLIVLVVSPRRVSVDVDSFNSKDRGRAGNRAGLCRLVPQGALIYEKRVRNSDRDLHGLFFLSSFSAWEIASSLNT